MNVLMVADGDTKYGASHSLIHMVEALKKNYEINISIISPANVDMKRKLKNIDCDVFNIHYTPFYQGIPNEKWKYPIKYIIKGLLYWYGRMRAVKEVEKQLELNKIDLIHSNSSREDLGALIANKFDIPLVWHIREFGDRDYKCYSYRRNYIQFMNESARRFIAVSDAVKEHWIKKGIQSEKVICVYNGIMLNDFRLELEDNMVQKRKQINLVMVGSISETKGQVWAIEALKRLKDENIQVSMDIIGDGSKYYVKKLKRKIAQYKLVDQVKFIGYQEEILSKLTQYDIGLMCSKDEAFGRVTVEYMMSGLCVIASNTGANQELIEDGVSGLLYQYGDTISLANAIKKCIRNSEFRNELRVNGYGFANQKFTAEKNAMQIYSIYQQIL